MGECSTPFIKRNEMTKESQTCPCGKCPECVKRRVSGWSFRLMMEEKRSLSAHFITLTYDTVYVPITRNGFMSLSKTDLQKFFKRLRKRHQSDVPIRYYAAGEYGGKTTRPHYHIILFNAKLDTIQPSWDRGSVHYGNVTGASIGYTLKYISKKRIIPIHRNDDRQPEFALMSKGIGENYIGKKMRFWCGAVEFDAMDGEIIHIKPRTKFVSFSKVVDWHKDDKVNRMYCNLEDGKKIAMPRYFKQKLYTDVERKAIGIEARKKMLQAEELARSKDPLYERNKAERVKAAFTKQHYRSKQNDKL